MKQPKQQLCKASNLAIVVVFLIAATVGVFLYKVLTPKPSYSDLAKNWTEAILAGDGSAAVAFLPDEDMRAYLWDSEDVRKFFREFVGPRMTKFKPKGAVEKSILNGGFMGMYKIRLASETKEFEFHGSVSATPEGPKSSMRDLLTMIWIAECLAKHDESEPIDAVAAAMDGIRRDKAELSALGVPGLVSSSGNGEFRTWDEILVLMEERRNQQSVR